MKECKLFVKSNKPGTNGLISWDDNGKIIIARNSDDEKPGYFDYSIIANKERCTIVELGGRHVEDLYHGISLEEAIDVLKEFRFEIYTKEYHLKQDKMIPERDKRDHETHLIAWNTERSIFINASTWYSETFNNFDVTIPSHGTSYLNLPYRSWCSECTVLSTNNKMNLSKIFKITEMDKYMKNDKIPASIYTYIHSYADECDEKECKKKEIEDLNKTSAAKYFVIY